MVLFGTLLRLSFAFSVLFWCAPASADPGRHWKMEDFGGVLSVGLEGHRNFANGRESYQTLCSKCHPFKGMPSGTASDLTRRALTYTPEELLGHILEPKAHPARREGILDALSQARVLDLLAFVLSGGDAESPFFFSP